MHKWVCVSTLLAISCFFRFSYGTTSCWQLTKRRIYHSRFATMQHVIIQNILIMKKSGDVLQWVYLSLLSTNKNTLSFISIKVFWETWRLSDNARKALGLQNKTITAWATSSWETHSHTIRNTETSWKIPPTVHGMCSSVRVLRESDGWAVRESD